MKIQNLLENKNLKKTLIKHIPPEFNISNFEISNKKCPKNLTQEIGLSMFSGSENPKSDFEELIDLIKPYDLQYGTSHKIKKFKFYPHAVSNTSIAQIYFVNSYIKKWNDFVLELLIYASLIDNIKYVFLLLPCQGFYYGFKLKKWKNKDFFKRILLDFISPKNYSIDLFQVQIMLITNKIGSSITIDDLDVTERNFTYQIFLTGFSFIKEQNLDIPMLRDMVSGRKINLFVHSPYTLNLASDEDYVYKSLQQHLKISDQIGCKGVVVHVGKQTTLTYKKAIKNMKKNILNALKFATNKCPLLLETPAGQGTEMLTLYEDFFDFVEKINHPNFGVCIDTCHINSVGYEPLEYFNNLALNEQRFQLVKLIHFNDSCTSVGSCVDKHAPIGTGTIQYESLSTIAYIGSMAGIPMVLE